MKPQISCQTIPIILQLVFCKLDNKTVEKQFYKSDLSQIYRPKYHIVLGVGFLWTVDNT